MTAPIMSEFYFSLLSFLGQEKMTRGFAVFQNRDIIGCYFPRNELRAFVEAIVAKVIHDPTAVDALHTRTIRANRRYFSFSRRVEQLNHRGLSDRALLRWYERIMTLQRQGHGMSQPTTWFIDSDGEDFSRYLREYVAGRIATTGAAEDCSAVFSILTTPLRDSVARKEERDLLALLVAVRHHRAVVRQFQRATAERPVDFAALPVPLQRSINAHFHKWRWAPYTYIGPAYEREYYLEQIRGMIQERANTAKLQQQYARVHRETKKKQATLFQKLNIDAHGRHLFRIAQDIVFIKEFRKACLFYGGYVRNMLLAEVARRLNISLMQAEYLLPHEVRTALLDRRVDPDELTARIVESVLVMVRGKVRVFTGRAAERFLARQRLERIVVPKTNELNGTCASPGKAKGIVRVINFPEEMGTMEPGNIMLSHTTYPALLPAMKKASAIVTEDGGITCHAAIVSRELKIPCIVGVKVVTAVFKNGDLVEVDASAGIVRKVEK